MYMYMIVHVYSNWKLRAREWWSNDYGLCVQITSVISIRAKVMNMMFLGLKWTLMDHKTDLQT